jgi:hypothetical protein
MQAKDRVSKRRAARPRRLSWLRQPQASYALAGMFVRNLQSGPEAAAVGGLAPSFRYQARKLPALTGDAKSAGRVHVVPNAQLWVVVVRGIRCH